MLYESELHNILMLHLSKFSLSNFCAIAKSLPQTNHYFTLFAGSYAEIIIGQFTTNFGASRVIIQTFH